MHRRPTRTISPEITLAHGNESSSGMFVAFPLSAIPSSRSINSGKIPRSTRYSIAPDASPYQPREKNHHSTYLSIGRRTYTSGPSFPRIGTPHFAPQSPPTPEHSKPQYTDQIRPASSMLFHLTKHLSYSTAAYTLNSISFGAWEPYRRKFRKTFPRDMLMTANIARRQTQRGYHIPAKHTPHLMSDVSFTVT